MLAVIVVNNVILLADHANQLRRAGGMEFLEAISLAVYSVCGRK